jgi:hypothetical protein
MIPAIAVITILSMVMLANLDQIRQRWVQVRPLLKGVWPKLCLAIRAHDSELGRKLFQTLPYLCFGALIVDAMIGLAMTTSVFAVVVAFMVVAYISLIILWLFVIKELLVHIYKRKMKSITKSTRMSFIVVWLQRQQIMLIDEMKWLLNLTKNSTRLGG